MQIKAKFFQSIFTKNYLFFFKLSNKNWNNTKEGDIFYAGVALFTMITRHSPFKYGPEKTDPYYKFFIEKNEKQFWDKFIKENHLNPDNFSPCFIDLLNKMLAYDWKQRITISEIKKHPWFLSDILTIDHLRKEMEKRVPQKEELRIKLEQKIQLLKHRKQGKDLCYNGVLPFRSLNFNVNY